MIFVGFYFEQILHLRVLSSTSTICLLQLLLHNKCGFVSQTVAKAKKVAVVVANDPYICVRIFQIEVTNRRLKKNNNNNSKVCSDMDDNDYK